VAEITPGISILLIEAAELVYGNAKKQGAYEMVLQGVGPYKVREPLFEGIRVILSFLHEQYTSEYIQGISGAAFRIGGICPCAPTCNYAIEPAALIKMLGFETEHIKTDKEVSMGKNTLKKIKEEIDKGHPVLVWHAFSNFEWDVVCGYSEKEKLFYGRGSYLGCKEYTSAEECRFLNCDICPGVIFIGQKVSSFNAENAEAAALKEAVKHACSKMNVDKINKNEWVFLEGMEAYKRWYMDFKSSEKKRTAGDSYCHSIYKATHRAAAGFLREIAQKYNKAEKYIIKSSEHFQKEADILEKANDLLSWNSPEGPDTENNMKISEIIKDACNQYISGIENMDKAICDL